MRRRSFPLARVAAAVLLLAAGPLRGQEEASRGEVFQWLRQARSAALAGDPGKARQLIADARAWAGKRKDPLATAWAEQLAGEVEFAAGDRAKATAAFTAALAAFTGLKNQPGTANCRVNLGRLALADGKAAEAIEHQRPAVELLEKLGRPAELAAALVDLGKSYRAVGRLDEAAAALRKALATYQADGVDQPAGELAARGELADLCEAAGKADDAAGHLTAAVTLAGKLKDAAAEAGLRNRLGMLLHKRGDLDAARKQYESALRLLAGVRNGQPTEAGVRNNLGALLQDQGQAAAALGELTRALELFVKVGDDGGQARSLYNAALVHEGQGRNEEAVAAYEKALALRRRSADVAATARVLDNLALLHAAAGRSDKARECQDEAAQLRRKK